MAFSKYASFDVTDILDIKGSAVRSHTASLDRISNFDAYRTTDGYMYVRLRAISSRTNKNHDGWPTIELAGSPEILARHTSSDGFTVEAADGNKEFGFSTFVGKPIFVDHNNGDPKRTRGVIVDSKFRILPAKEAKLDPYWSSEDVDPAHLPASEIELLLEIDAQSFPKLAADILNGDLDGFSMGADVERSVCSHCANVATNPEEYCSHVRMKGADHDYKTADGKRTHKRSYENCYGIKFFEISAVFDPADETALTRDVTAKTAAVVEVACPHCGQPAQFSTNNRTGLCTHCGATFNNPQNPQTPQSGPIFASTKQAEMYPPDETGFPPADPVRGNQDFDTQRLVQEYLNKGIPEHNAIEMAHNKVQREQPLAVGGGDGAVYTPKMVDYSQGIQTDNQGMPGPGGLRGFPPPQRLNEEAPAGVDPAFFGDAQDALNEQWPQRPRENDFHWSSVHVADSEPPLPQSMKVHAPEEVDTLRDESVCPICGNDMEGETCDVCGYVEPPKNFQNPDLSQAEQIRNEMKQQEDAAAQPGGGQGPQPPTGDTQQQQQGLGAPPATKAQPTARVTNRMSWTPLVTPKTAARINQVEKPVGAPNVVTTNEPTTQVVKSDQTRPVTSAMLTAQRLMATAQRNHTGESMSTRTADATSPGDTAPLTRVDVTGVGGVADASNEAASKAQSQVDVNGVGGTGVEGVEADKTESLPTASQGSDDSGFNTDKTTEDSGPTATFGDSDGTEKGVTDAVTSEPFPASEDGVKAAAQYHRAVEAARLRYEAARLSYDDNTLEQNEQQGDPAAKGGTAVKGVQPVSETFGDRVNLLEHTTSPENNSGPTSTWSGTDGNGVLKQQEPTTSESQEWGGVKVPDVQLHTTGKAHFMAALKLAETEVELGLIDREAKFNRIAELDAQSPLEVETQLKALARVKTAGLAKLAQQRQAGVRRLPSAFGKATAAPNGFERIASDVPAEPQPVTDELLDAALFTR